MTMLRLQYDADATKAVPETYNNIIIIIFYCGLMVHITDIGAQKAVSYTSAHITETVFAHDQH